jgi:hypothetical protein
MSRTVTATVYAIKSFKDCSAVLGGWELNAILSLQSGMPAAVTRATNNNSFAGFALQRPNIVGNQRLPAGRGGQRITSIRLRLLLPQFVIESLRAGLARPGYGAGEAYEAVGADRAGVTAGDVRCDQYAGVFTAEWKFRRGRVWEHYEHDDRSAGGAVCASAKQGVSREGNR